MYRMRVRISKKTLRSSSTTPQKNRRRNMGRIQNGLCFRGRRLLPLLQPNNLLETPQPPPMEGNRPRVHLNLLRKTPRPLHTRSHISIRGMVLTTKKCYSCGQNKDISEFYKWNASKDGHVNVCKQCKKEKYAQRTEKEKEHTRKLQRNNRRKNKERDREKYNEYMKLYMKLYDYLKGDGCCLYCGETNPFMLNNHHTLGRKNGDFTITLCEDHHEPFTRGMPFVLEEWYPPR